MLRIDKPQLHKNVMDCGGCAPLGGIKPIPDPSLHWISGIDPTGVAMMIAPDRAKLLAIYRIRALQ
jgi:hypothetical protein